MGKFCFLLGVGLKITLQFKMVKERRHGARSHFLRKCCGEISAAGKHHAAVVQILCPRLLLLFAGKERKEGGCCFLCSVSAEKILSCWLMMQRNSLKKEHPETYRRPKSKNKRCMWAGKHRNSASISIFRLERVGLSILFAMEILLLLQTGEPLGTVG